MEMAEELAKLYSCVVKGELEYRAAREELTFL